VTEAFQHDGPALIDAVVNRTELSMPPTIKLDLAVGSKLWVLKGRVAWLSPLAPWMG
jgi:pyruvate dehydrogenase (quinone)